MKIRVKYHNPNIEGIKIQLNGDWIDLRAAETVSMKAGDFKLISLGVSMKLPEGYEAHVVPRSSTFKKWGVLVRLVELKTLWLVCMATEVRNAA